MNLEPGQRLKVIRGIPHTDRAAWMETGDVVRVVEVYDHVVLVERPYRANGKKMMRECFPLKNAHLFLKEVVP